MSPAEFPRLLREEADALARAASEMRALAERRWIAPTYDEWVEAMEAADAEWLAALKENAPERRREGMEFRAAWDASGEEATA